jgi:hypothetical protein
METMLPGFKKQVLKLKSVWNKYILYAAEINHPQNTTFYALKRYVKYRIRYNIEDWQIWSFLPPDV